MKYLNTLIFTLLIVNSPSGYSAFILTGEQEIYNFNSSDFNQTSTINNNGANFGFSFANSFDLGGLEDTHLYNGHLELGETLRVDFYENQGDLTPIETHTLLGQDPEIDGYAFVWSDILNNGSTFIPWLDHEGSIVFTSIAGEIELNAPVLTFHDAGTQFSTNLSITAVPLPPSLPLFVTSIISLLLFQRKNITKS